MNLNITIVKKLLLFFLLFIMIFPSVALASVTIYTDTYLYDMDIGGFTLFHKTTQTYDYVEVGSDYINLTGGNITFVNNITTTHTLIERDGEFGLGDYRTTLSCDVYKPSDWTLTYLYFRIYGGDDSLIMNISKTSLIPTILNSTHVRYTYNNYNPADTLAASKMGGFDLNIYAYAYNSTLIYSGNKTAHDLFTVYILDHPTGVYANFTYAWNSVNISWDPSTADNHSDFNVLYRRNDTYPTAPLHSIDANAYLLYNGTNNWYNDTIGTPGSAFYLLCHYNSSSRSYASYYVVWGALYIWNVYNESNPTQSIWYNMQIINSTTQYTILNAHDTLIYNFSQIPYGANTRFIIGNGTGQFRQRTYIKNLLPNYIYNYSFYLPPVTQGEGMIPEENYTYLYQVQVVGPMYEHGTSPPIENALVQIYRYINVSDTFEEVASMLTDANGYCNPGVYLISNGLVTYKFVATKDGYNTSTSFVIPSPTQLTITIRMYPLQEIIPVLPHFFTNITFTAVMLANCTLLVNYTDNASTTLDTDIYVYEIYMGTWTLVYSDSQVSNYNFQVIVGVNCSRTYVVTLFFNNSVEYDITSPFSITVYPVTIYGSVDIEERFTNIFGDNPLGWFNVISVAIAVVLLVSFGVFDAGFGIIAAGAGLTGTQIIFAMFFSNVNVVLISVGSVVIFIGIIYMWTKGEASDKL